MAMQEIVRNGLPLHLFTKGGAIALGLCIAATFIAGNEIYHFVKKRTTEPTQAAPCFEPERAHYTPGAKSLPAAVPTNEQQRDMPALWRLKDAERVCKPTSCDSAALRAYESAFFWYIADRMQVTRGLDMNHGDPGLARARRLYGTPDDLAIEQGLRERYRAKLFRINDQRQHRDVKSILIFKGGEAMRPCRKGDV
jgi:hypothetical protein